MRTRTRIHGFFVAVIGFAVIVAFSPKATATRPRPPAPEEACFPLAGAIRVEMNMTGCTSPVGLCTSGTFRSPFVSGTTRFRASGLGGQPMGEASIVSPPSEPTTTWSYAGELTISTRIGDLVLRDVGVLDTVAGTFTELNRPVSGTGTFAGATGNVYISGTVTGGVTGFEGRVTGNLCVPLD